jgi:hypothetical protein
MNEEKYKCEYCGKIVKTKDKKIPKCCNHPMKKIPLDICIQSTHPEHTRTREDEEPCDDGRAG